MFDNVNIQTSTPANIIEITNNDMESYIKKAKSLVGISQQNASKTGAFVEQSKTTLDECKKIRDVLKEEIESLGEFHSTMTNNPHNVTAEQVGAYSKEEIDAKNYLTNIPSEYVTEDVLVSKGYLTSSDVSNFATKTELDLKQPILIAGDNITLENNVVSTSFDVVNTDLSNLTDVGTKVIDGQFVTSELVLSTTTTVGSYELDLSDYLPSDDYIYEIILSVHVVKNSVKFTQVFISSDLFYEKIVAHVTQYGETATNIFSIPLKSRKLIFRISNNAPSSQTLCVCGYRRLGINK
ncbi:hypothetical protein IKJ53_06180 [bacterium]|nr:hypothetical protein [bacterium]